MLHYTDSPLEIGAVVDGQIDWARRFDLMQQHSGEHMVSGVVHRIYGFEQRGLPHGRGYDHH